MAAVLAAACLAVAGGWRAWLIRCDARHIREAHAGCRAYRPELGWTDCDLLALRMRWAYAGLLASGALALSLAVPAATVAVWPAAGLTLAVWIARHFRVEYGRYGSVCISTLAIGVALAGVWPAAGGLLASIAAAQMYLVAGVRKLRAPGFMSGRVVLDNIAYAACQAAAGNRDFVRIASPARIADLLERGTLLRGCRAAAVATAVAELTIGAGATGALPLAATLAIAVPLHLGFMVLSPRRLLPFTAASIGMLLLAAVNPVFDPW